MVSYCKFAAHIPYDLSLGFMDFINKKDLELCILQNDELLTHFTSSNYQNFAKKGKSEVCAFIVMLLIVIQELLPYCETLKAS